MAQYKNFFEAYMAKQSQPTPAQSTWTPGNLQNLANAYSSLNPTWTPPAAQNAALPNPITPVTFDPMLDPGYAAGSSAVTNANQHAQAEYGLTYTDENGVVHPGYQTARGAQVYGYNAQGQFDPTNPYSQAAILKKNYADTQRGQTNSYAASGQLYSGALQNAHAASDYQYGASSDQLQRAASDFYHGNAQQLQGVSDAGVSQLAALLGPAFAAFLQNQKGY